MIWRDVDGAATEPTAGPTVVTIGNFDGVHRGHAHVLARARALAERLGDGEPLPVIAVTFDPHPLEVIAPARAPLQLNSLERRIALLHEAGADQVYVLAFDTAMSQLTPEKFIQLVLIDQLHVAGVAIGANFRYGHKAAGDLELLRKVGASAGFAVDGLSLDGGAVAYSSTLVRSLVAAGDVAAAAAVLGRPHSVTGIVVKGDQRGRELGFPTANLPVEPAMAVPSDGVYSGWLVRADGNRLPASISVGTNPTFKGIERRVESYVLDRTDLDLYGEEVRVEFIQRLRGMVKYEGAEALIAQMNDDVNQTRTSLSV